MGNRERGARTELLDLREYDLPVFDPNADPPADAEALTDRIEAANAVLLGTPVYHGSYSSPLKTALDYCGFEEFEDTTVGLLAVSGGGFPLPALSHLREVCRAFEAWVLPHQAAVTVPDPSRTATRSASPAVTVTASSQGSSLRTATASGSTTKGSSLSRRARTSTPLSAQNPCTPWWSSKTAPGGTFVGLGDEPPL